MADEVDAGGVGGLLRSGTPEPLTSEEGLRIVDRGRASSGGARMSTDHEGHQQPAGQVGRRGGAGQTGFAG